MAVAESTNAITKENLIEQIKADLARSPDSDMEDELKKIISSSDFLKNPVLYIILFSLKNSYHSKLLMNMYHENVDIEAIRQLNSDAAIISYLSFRASALSAFSLESISHLLEALTEYLYSDPRLIKQIKEKLQTNNFKRELEKLIKDLKHDRLEMEKHTVVIGSVLNFDFQSLLQKIFPGLNKAPASEDFVKNGINSVDA